MVVLLVSVHKRDLLHRWRRGCVPGLPTRQFIRPRGTEPSRVHRWVAGSVSMCVEGGRPGGGGIGVLLVSVSPCVEGGRRVGGGYVGGWWCVYVCGGRAGGGGIGVWLVLCLRLWRERGGGGGV